MDASAPSDPVSHGDAASVSTHENYGRRSSRVNELNTSFTSVSVVNSNSYDEVKTDGDRDGQRYERKTARGRRWRNKNVYLAAPAPQNVEVVQIDLTPTRVVTWDEEYDGVETYLSHDGTRAVKIDEDTRDAYLCDRSESPAFQPIFIGSNVKSAKFSEDNSESPLLVRLTMQDGTFGLFDATGSAYQAYASRESADIEPIDDMSQR